MDRAEAEAIYDSGREACVEFILGLVARVEQHEDRLRRLEGRARQDSRTSSKPPSMDPPKTRAERRAEARAKAKELMRREGERRQAGGQPGHRGAGRELKPEDQVDEIVDHYPVVARFSEVVPGVAVGPSARWTACHAACSATWRPRTCGLDGPRLGKNGAAPDGGVDAPSQARSRRYGIGIRSFSRSSYSCWAARSRMARRRASEHQSRASLSRSGTGRVQRQRGLGVLARWMAAPRESKGGTDRSGPGSASGTFLSAVGLVDGRLVKSRRFFKLDCPARRT